MKDRRRIGVVWVGVCCVWLSVGLAADTLVMRDGRRVEGQVVSMRNGIIVFEGRRGFFGGRERIEVDRADVRRIELDDVAEDDYTRDRGSELDRSQGRPSGLRERDISVDSWEQWKDTGIDVRAGQSVYFNATGRVRWGPGRQDGPAGENGSPYNASRPIPGRPAAALVGRIGEGGDYFFIGDEKGAIRARASGRLYLGVNDDYLKDNTGSFRVTVYY